MSFVQTSYSENMAVAVAGAPDNHDFSANTFTAEGGAIGFGVVVGQGTADRQAVLGATTGTALGVTIRSIVANTEDTYPENANMSVMYRGQIWVTVGGDVVAGGAVTFADATGVLSSVAAGAGQTALEGARWMSSASNGGLALLHLGGALPSA